MAATEIKLIVPKGTSITIVEAEEERSPEPHRPPTPPRKVVERYWRDYLSESGRKIFETAALIERESGPGFTLDEIADARSTDYDTAKAWHRNTGRTAKRWREETQTPEPLFLEDMNEYGWRSEFGGDRTVYRLPPGVQGMILEIRSQ